MDASTASPPAAQPPATTTAPHALWPRSARLAVGILLGLLVFAIFGQSFLTSFGARPDPSPAPTVELNSANHAELMLLPGIGDLLAARILKYRDDHGPFQSIEALRRVPGIAALKFDRVKELIYVDPPQYALTKESAAIPVVEAATRPGSGKKAPTKPIAVNSASLADLQQLPGIGPKLSQRIVDERAKKRFATVADMRRVPGIGAKTLEKIKPHITVE